MSNRTLVTTGSIGGALAAICCATPILAVVLGAAGLASWAAKADYVVIPALLICLGLVGIGLYRGRSAVQDCCDPAAPTQGTKS